jgi:hypothetical protein
MKTFTLGIALLLVSGMVHANVSCFGAVQRVYAGAHGPSPAGNMFWVQLPSGIYRLGLVTDDLAKGRYAMALSAFMAGRPLVLKFFSHTTCDQALLDGVTPTEMYMDP